MECIREPNDDDTSYEAYGTTENNRKTIYQNWWTTVAEAWPQVSTPLYQDLFSSLFALFLHTQLCFLTFNFDDFVHASWVVASRSVSLNKAICVSSIKYLACRTTELSIKAIYVSRTMELSIKRSVFVSRIIPGLLRREKNTLFGVLASRSCQ